ncbi:hypothetical protein ACQZV8_13215 [Magnetococcales bacterium HHB-1]
MEPKHNAKEIWKIAHRAARLETYQETLTYLTDTLPDKEERKTALNLMSKAAYLRTLA